MAGLLNPCELQIDLFCKGMRIDASCTLDDDARHIARTRAGLGSGLEIVIPGPKEIWLNVPIEEDFAATSSYRLEKRNGAYFVIDTARGWHYPIQIPHEPRWYNRKTSNGTPMWKIGVLQGTYLGIYIGPPCAFHAADTLNCKFCTTGQNVGVNEEREKRIDDVVETVLAARAESGVTFVHFNSGHQGEGQMEMAERYVRAVKDRAGGLVGVQFTPARDLTLYDRLIDAGADHFSFCFEFYNPDYFARLLPGKQKYIGQEAFFRAMEYAASKLGKGTCSGEIIAGVEPIEDTLAAIDYIASVGAFPTVCIFRPTIGSDMEQYPPPRYDDMVVVMRRMYEACMRNSIPIGVLPNIEVSLIVQPTDARYLVDDHEWRYQWYHTRMRVMRTLARPVLAQRMKPRERALTAR